MKWLKKLNKPIWMLHELLAIFIAVLLSFLILYNKFTCYLTSQFIIAFGINTCICFLKFRKNKRLNQTFLLTIFFILSLTLCSLFYGIIFSLLFYYFFANYIENIFGYQFLFRIYFTINIIFSGISGYVFLILVNFITNIGLFTGKKDPQKMINILTVVFAIISPITAKILTSNMLYDLLNKNFAKIPDNYVYDNINVIVCIISTLSILYFLLVLYCIL